MSEENDVPVPADAEGNELGEECIAELSCGREEGEDE